MQPTFHVIFVTDFLHSTLDWNCRGCYHYPRDRYGPTLLDFTSPNDNTEWTQVSCAHFTLAATTKKGEPYMCGSNFCGELGHGDTVSRGIPTKVIGLDGIIIIKVVCGLNHMAALTNKGELLTWYVRYRALHDIDLPLYSILSNLFRIRYNHQGQGRGWAAWTW